MPFGHHDYIRNATARHDLAWTSISCLEQASKPARLLLFLLLAREFFAGSLLVLASNGVGDVSVLGLFGRALIVLGTLLEDVLLDPVDSC